MDLFSLRPAVPAAQQCFPAACRPSVAGFYVRVECGDSFDMPAGVYLVNRSWDRRVPRRRAAASAAAAAAAAAVQLVQVGRISWDQWDGKAAAVALLCGPRSRRRDGAPPGDRGGGVREAEGGGHLPRSGPARGLDQCDPKSGSACPSP